MDIRRSVSYSVMLYLSLVVVIFVAAVVCFADTKTPANALIATYESGVTVTPLEAKSAITHLEEALGDCEDSQLAFRIRYRIGVIHFKAGTLTVSKTKFLQVVNDSRCPGLIRVCSFNMIGQISRLQGENAEALEAFDRVANLAKQAASSGTEHNACPALAKLWCSALLSRAEIYELQGDYTGAIAEYSRLLHAPGQGENDDVLSQCLPSVNDRLSQLHLRQGQTEKYIKLASALTIDYPEYYRTPIISLELECVKFLNNVHADLEFLNGSFTAPARLIAYCKSSKGGTPLQPLIDKFGRLYKGHQDTYAGIQLSYHYALLLDTVGEKQKAMEALARISSSDTVNTNGSPWERVVVETIREYTKIQHAIMLGERADYNQALRVLSSLRTGPDKSHISELAKSVSKNIQILKREAPSNESE